VRERDQGDVEQGRRSRAPAWGLRPSAAVSETCADSRPLPPSGGARPAGGGPIGYYRASPLDLRSGDC